MEGIHGVDVSWLHHANREHRPRLRAPTSPGLAKDAPPKTSSHGGLPVQPLLITPSDKNTASVTSRPAPPELSLQPPSPTLPKSSSRRPGLMGRASSEKSAASTSSQSSDGSKTTPRRGSWISSLSSKFGGLQQSPTGLAGTNGSPKTSQDGASQPGAGAQNNGQQQQQLPSAKEGTPSKNNPAEDVEPYVPQAPKSSSSFFSNALRRLSSSSAASASGKVYPYGGMCPRRVMNVDPNRERCSMPELDQTKLRKVSFCVDVEIAGGPKYNDEEPEVENKKKKKKNKDKKMEEKGEGAALKNPQAAAEEKDKRSKAEDEHAEKAPAPDLESTVQDGEEKSDSNEKNKRTEEEKRERADKKRRRAEESGSIPREFSRDGDSSPSNTSGTATPRPQDRPTTDPARIYRRCCQLRESPILKRITEQLTQPSACPINTPGVVTCLNLTGSRLQLPDVVALSDWLAIVPVKKLLLEDADLTDEGVRVILAGLLATKHPHEQRTSLRHQKAVDHLALPPKELHHERLGVVEKLVLKNNPRLTAEAWKHISLFVYMCRSIKGLDVSMNAFPQPPVPQVTEDDTSSQLSRQESDTSADIGEIFAKALSSRLAGDELEELVMAECQLATPTLRKIIDAVIMSGVRRLGIAGNRLDEEGFESVVHYLRSDVCQGIDLANNNLRDRLGQLVKGLSPQSPLWALSLADNNLTPESLKPLLPALLKLPNFRFIDLSHNHDLFQNKPDALPLLRKYIPQLQHIKRLHLCDVALSPRQAIALAEVLPESPNLAHLNILENPQLQHLASATAEADQEEACALYASLMAAARVSDTIICIDIDVPSQDNSEIVKALAKQVVAYCLQNMEQFAATELLQASEAVSAASLESHGPPITEKEIEVPEVLLHLVGHVEGNHENHDNDDPAPDDDYIVGGTGVVKALTYCLSEKAAEMKKDSAPNSGSVTPQQMKFADAEGGTRVKARKLSKNLLDSARKIRMRLQPALVKEAKAGDDMAYRRLQFLDDTLKQIIDRFEAEYPETRISAPSEVADGSAASTSSLTRSESALSSSADPSSYSDTSSSTFKEGLNNSGFDESDEDDREESRRRSLHASDVSQARRMMGLEEGRMHKLGQAIRQDILRPPQGASDAAADDSSSSDPQPADIADLRRKLENLLHGAELRDEVRREGWEEVMRKVGTNIEELKKLRKAGEMGDLGPEEERDWAAFRESQEKAQENVRTAREGKTDSAIAS